jgi:omega-6 fatty acid desaturase (delta-12 desaturase)
MNPTGNPMPVGDRPPRRDPAAWKAIVLKYQEPSLWRAIWQLVNSVGPYAFLWYVAYLSLAWSYWITAGCAILAGLLLVRIFIIFHDCGHSSFFKSRLANDVVGFITGVITLTPYFHWRWEHSIHHASAGSLDRRGVGDVWTMTVEEYLQAPLWERLAYRLMRNPVILFGLAPIYMFVLEQRLWSSKASPRERWSVHWMNCAILAVAVALSSVFGFWAYLGIQLTIVAVGGGLGVWLFYVQHQYEDVYWQRDHEWDFTTAALEGSSYYQLPRILQWFSGNIGFHHIHHLSSRIPNYNLERCHNADALFQEVKPLTFLSSLKSLTVHLWDEQGGKLVGFSHLRGLQK